LWNQKVFDSIFEGFEGDMHCDNVFGRMKFLFETHETCQREVEFYSSDFFKLAIAERKGTFCHGGANVDNPLAGKSAE
jgi:hypothetical protein